MDASLCRDHLQRLLTEEASALSKLEAVLNKEHQFISDNDLEALETTGAERDFCVTALLKIDAERLSLCRSTGREADKHGLLSLIAWCDHQDVLRRRWHDNAALILQTRKMNDRNGALVNNRLRRVEGLLDSLNGNTAREQKVYTARGNAYQQNQSGRVFNVQA